MFEERLEGVGLGGREEGHGGHHVGWARVGALVVIASGSVRGGGGERNEMVA